jgi:hypothetical protein
MMQPLRKSFSDNYSGCVAIGKYFVEQMHKKGNMQRYMGLLVIIIHGTVQKAFTAW